MQLVDHMAALLVLMATLYAMMDGKRFQERLCRIDQEPNGRIRLYWSLLWWLWGTAAVVLGLWIYQGYDFALLGFRIEPAWQFWVICSVVVVTALFYAAYILRLRNDAGLQKKTRASLESTKVDQLIPRSPQELRFWSLLSVSAASEEVVYRGFILWYLGSFTNIIVAAVVSTLLFALAHSYQGKEGVAKSAIAGAVLLAVYWISGSIWPAIVLHIIQDLVGGVAGYLSYPDKRQQVDEMGKQSG